MLHGKHLHWAHLSSYNILLLNLVNLHPEQRNLYPNLRVARTEYKISGATVNSSLDTDNIQSSIQKYIYMNQRMKQNLVKQRNVQCFHFLSSKKMEEPFLNYSY